MAFPIAQFIRDELARRGVIRFTALMDLALYHPGHGYYLQPEIRTGKAGDFFTNVSVGSVYGQLLADQFAAMHQLLGAPAQFTILEQGAEDGQLASDILEHLSQAAPQTCSAVTYLVVEPHRSKQRVQQDRLAAFGSRVTWVSRLDEVRPFTGVAHAHELVDAFPVHLVEHQHPAGWRELGVALDGDRLVYAPLPELAPELAAHLKRIPIPPPGPPYRTEVNLAALGWIRDLARVLDRGFVLILDYGYPRDLYYAPHRREGTLSCYRRHRRDHDPLSALGEKDITAHVDFTSLAEAGVTAGLEVAGFTDQHHFMVGAAEKRLRELSDVTRTGGPAGHDARFLRELQTLLHPAHLGTAFHYLLFTRPALPAPAGFKYARDPRRELGLGLGLGLEKA